MFSNVFIAFVAAIGIGGWTYSKTQRRTGNNTNSSLKAAAAVGGLAFLVVLVLLAMLT